MLIEKIRAHAGAWWFRAFLGLLALTFVFLWYGPDMLVRGGGGGNPTLATVGGQKITMHQFAGVFRQELMALQSTTDKPVTNEMQQYLYGPVLSRMVDETLLDREAARLGVRVTDEHLRMLIATSKPFLNESGSFDKRRLQVALNSLGLSEAAFIRDVTERTIRSYLGALAAEGVVAPRALATPLFGAVYEKRNVVTATLATAGIKLAQVPTQDEVEAFYKENTSTFTAPEYRDLSVVVLELEPLIEKVKIESADLQAAFDARQSEFAGKSFDAVKSELEATLKKQRGGEQLYALNTKIDDALAGGATLEEVAKTYALSVQKIQGVAADGSFEGGAKPKAAWAQPVLLKAVVTEAYGLKTGMTSATIEASDSRFFAVRVDGAKESHVQPFAEVAARARAMLEQKRRSEEGERVAREIVAQVKMGADLAVLARLRGLTVSEVSLTRQKAEGVPAALLNDIFRLRGREAAMRPMANAEKQKDYMIVSLRSIVKADPKIMQKEVDDFAGRVRGMLAQDIYAGYLESIKKRNPVELNQKALKNLMKADVQN